MPLRVEGQEQELKCQRRGEEALGFLAKMSRICTWRKEVKIYEPASERAYLADTVATSVSRLWKNSAEAAAARRWLLAQK